MWCGTDCNRIFRIHLGGYTMQDKRLYRSDSNKMLAGVCGGIGEYFNIDPTLVRLGWVVFSAVGAGVLAYIVAAIIIPKYS